MSNFYILAAGEGDVVSGEMMGDDGMGLAVDEMQQTGADGSNGGGEGGQGETERPASPFGGLIWMIPLFILMYMLMFRGPKKKQQQHQKMVQALQKNDKVRTIGGILGTVIDVKDDEIMLKIDESNNTKIRITAGAVSKVVSNETN
jgi:preprotein translocase subunit YajC